MKIALATLMLLGLTANATPPNSKQDNTVQHWLLVATEKEDFNKTYAYMKGHQSGAGQIPVILDGDGSYLLNAVDAIRDTDWFPNTSVLGNQVEEVRILCSPIRSKLNIPPRAVLPIDVELTQNRKIRIEIPCEQTVESAVYKMQLAQALLKRIANDPDSAVASFETVITACKTEPNGNACKNAKTKAGEILSGDITKPLTAPDTACDVEIDAGVTKKRVLTTPSTPKAPPTMEELGAKINWTSKRIDELEIFDFLQKALESCGITTTQSRTLVPNWTTNDFQKCVLQIQSLRTYLKTKGIEFLKYHLNTIDGKIHHSWGSITNTREKVASTLDHLVDNIMNNEAIRAMQTTPNITGTKKDWQQAFDISDLENVGVERKDKSQFSYNHGRTSSDNCDLDMNCRLREKTIQEGFQKALQENTAPGKCYTAKGILGQNGAVTYSFTEVACNK